MNTSDAPYCLDCLQPRTSAADRHCRATSTRRERTYHRWSDDGEPVSRCPACGEPIDYCQGHGEIGDPYGHATLVTHDMGLHLACHPDACQEW